MFTFRFYTPDDRPAWDECVLRSRNGVFLFLRAYLEYHADRFEDASVVIHAEGHPGRIVAVLPANRQRAPLQPTEHGHGTTADAHGDTFVTHGGLTFGGLVMDEKLGGTQVVTLLRELLPWLAAHGFARLKYKPTPHLYHRLPSEEDLYALHQLGAQTTQVLLSSTLDLTRPCPASSARKNALRIANRHAIKAGPCAWEDFWPLLTQTLQQRHGVNPVHSLEEIRLLASRFPDRLEVLGGWPSQDASQQLQAGAVLFHYDGVTHTQYLASSPAGRDSHAQHRVIDTAIESARARGQRWFSFGTSTTEGGHVLNDGLLHHKEIFGARGTILQTLELDLPGH